MASRLLYSLDKQVFGNLLGSSQKDVLSDNREEPMHCTRCQGLMVLDDLVDLQESCVPMWMRGLRCVACGNIVDPLILRHRVMQKSGGRPLLKSRLPVPALAGHIKATAA